MMDDEGHALVMAIDGDHTLPDFLDKFRDGELADLYVGCVKLQAAITAARARKLADHVDGDA